MGLGVGAGWLVWVGVWVKPQAPGSRVQASPGLHPPSPATPVPPPSKASAASQAHRWVLSTCISAYTACGSAVLPASGSAAEHTASSCGSSPVSSPWSCFCTQVWAAPGRRLAAGVSSLERSILASLGLERTTCGGWQVGGGVEGQVGGWAGPGRQMARPLAAAIRVHTALRARRPPASRRAHLVVDLQHVSAAHHLLDAAEAHVCSGARGADGCGVCRRVSQETGGTAAERRKSTHPPTHTCEPAWTPLAPPTLHTLFTPRTRHVGAQLLGHHEQKVDDVLRLPCKLGAQHRVLQGGGWLGDSAVRGAVGKVWVAGKWEKHAMEESRGCRGAAAAARPPA